MGFTGAVQWWDEWQLRVLVLASLFIQFFLFFTASLRKCNIPAWFRFIIWLAYLGSDAVAVYTLAVLYNRQNQQEWVSKHRSSYSLQVLWAPILLEHLGGQDGITAYNIEDNELWKRHVVTAVSQVSVAVYVFCKSWTGDTLVLRAAILVFISGAVKCIFKPWDLKRVSINSLVGSSGSKENIGQINSLDQYIGLVTCFFQGRHAAQTIFQQLQLQDPNSETLQPADRGEIFRPKIWKPYSMFVDLTPSYSARFNYLRYMLFNPGKAHLLVQCGLSVTFDRLYTKKTLQLPGSPAEPSISELANRSRWWLPWFFTLDGIIYLIRLLPMSGTLILLLLFRKSDKQVYNHTDVIITFVLLYPPAILEFISPLPLIIIRATERVDGRRPWPDHVAQYNLIGYLARYRKHWILTKLASLLSSKDFLDQQWCMKPLKSSRDITELVSNHVTAGWEQQIHDIASYRRFNDSRGQLTLGREGLLDTLGWSLRRPFDESLLLWHLATDMCFHRMAAAMGIPAAQEATHRSSKAMSNYMAYLLLVNPEMLIPGARRSLFRDAYKELDGIVSLDDDDDQPLLGDEELTDRIIQRVMATEGSGVAHEAWAIAQVLVGLQVGEDVDKVWRVVQGVWVEMLCFSAGRCRGYLHAKSMGSGGQYLSYVWLLLLYMGMETLAEKMQRADERDEAGTGTAAVPRPAAATSPGGDVGSASPTQAADLTPGSPTRAASPPAPAPSDNNDVVLTMD